MTSERRPCIYVPAQSAQDWQRLLADPEKHWRIGYSARTLAACWQEAQGFPPCVLRAFSNSSIEVFRNPSLLLAVPEYKVDLPGGARPTQNDLFALARTDRGLLTITVEGKVGEPFGPLVSEWRSDRSEGKEARLAFLCQRLGLTPDAVMNCRYQLLHRTVASLLEAARFHAKDALMLVHSFSGTKQWFEDYESFAACFGLTARADTVQRAKQSEGVDLYIGWASGESRFLQA